MMVSRSVAANNDYGLATNGTGAYLLVGQSTVSGNASGWQVFNGGQILSYGTNQINGTFANQSQIPAVTRGSN
jgi:hypothetical protein